MQTEFAERPVPFTSSRAWTELVRSRQQVDGARRSLELALEIFRRLNDDPPAIPLSALDAVLGQLEEAEALLWETAQ
ncbi:MAG: hypothetical protein ACRDH7_04785 [Actinomycetota bacterium]